MRTVSLRQAWVALIGGVLLLGLVPAGIALDRRLTAELERQARSDLGMAPRILADRNASRSDALMMRAKEMAGSPLLAEAVATGRRERALEIARASLSGSDAEPSIVGAGGEAWTEPPPPRAAVAATRGGRMPVEFGHHAGRLYRFSLAPVRVGDRWVGAVGLVSPVGEAMAGELAGLTRSEVALLGPGGTVLSSTGGTAALGVLRDSAASWSDDGLVHEVTAADGDRYWAAVAPLGEAGRAAFLLDVDERLSLLPEVRRSGLVAMAIALVLALALGGFLAARMASPVRALAVASQRLSAGDFGAPVPDSRLREVDQVSRAFREMRSRLQEKIGELTAANRALEDRQARLQALQSELIQRDRLSATGRIITELAHEIRNPVAGVRNCLEIIHRRLEDGSELREFSSMAIDELLRMHRLSEQMLDANRPLDPEADTCRPVEVAEKVAELAAMARAGGGIAVSVEGYADAEVAMSPDGLKQVILNLVENAREAMAGRPDGEAATVAIIVGPGTEANGEGIVRIEVLDSGPGLEADVEPRIFDPFFTTKDEVHGVGLGLFVAQGLVRRHGGSIRAENRAEGGARFVIRLPAAATGGERSADGGTRPA